jgi:hypothetical protein
MAKRIETKQELEEMEKPFDFDTFEIKELADFQIWNLHARKAFREAKKRNPKCDPPIHVKVPDESFHKKIKIKFQRFDQPENVLKINVRTRDIDWQGQLKPGAIYDLPLPVVRFLNNLSVPIFSEVKVDDGGEVRTETRQVGERNRFSCHLMELV